MENASKALLMAGSVILSLIIISSVVIMYNNLRTSQAEVDNVKDVQDITKENEKFLAFEKSFMYGSELLSLANLIEDYNERNTDTGKTQMVAYVQFVEEIKDSKTGAVVLQKKTYTIQEAISKITSGSKELQTDFKRKYFFCQQANTKYDQAGRIKEMSFVQAVQ